MTDDTELDGDVLNLDIRNPDDERQWIVLFDEDYDNVMLDGDDRVALLVDIEQAGELLRLSTLAIAALGTADGSDDVIGALIERLEEVRDDD